MASIDNDITIDRSPEDVFAFLTNPENDPKWVGPSMEHHHTSDGPIGVGSTSHEISRVMGRATEYDWVVTRYEPPRAYSTRSTSGPFAVQIDQRLEPAGNGTRLTLHVEAELDGALKFLGPLIAAAGDRRNRRDLATLKRVLEGWVPPPPGTTGLPVIGETAQLARGIFPFINERLARHGRTFRTSIMGMDTAVISGPDSCLHFIDEAKVVRDGGSPRHIQRIFAGPSLSSIDGRTHRNHKVVVMEAFTPEALGSYLPAIERQISASLMSSASAGEVRWLPELKRLAIGIICENVLGMEPGPKVSRITSDYEVVTRGSLGLPFELPGTALRRSLKARDRILEVFVREVAAHRRGPRDDGLSRMIAADAPDGSRLTDEEMVFELHHLIIAGYIIFAVFARMAIEFDRYPEVAAEVKKEVAAFDVSAPLTLGSLDAMHFLDRVVMETKRVTPIIPAISGRSISGFEYEGAMVPNGWRVLWAPWSTNQDSQFTDPERFDPDRYSPARAEHLSHPYAFTPQGPGGPLSHRCAGVEYSTYLMKAFAVHLLRGYEWEIPSQNFDYDWRFIPPEYKDGLRIRLRRVS